MKEWILYFYIQLKSSAPFHISKNLSWNLTNIIKGTIQILLNRNNRGRGVIKRLQKIARGGVQSPKETDYISNIKIIKNIVTEENEMNVRSSWS